MVIKDQSLGSCELRSYGVSHLGIETRLDQYSGVVK